MFYDGMGRPAEIVLYDDEHVQISKIVRTYDERGRVTSEENQTLSPRVFDWQRDTQGEEMPKEMAQMFARIFTKGPMRMTYKAMPLAVGHRTPPEEIVVGGSLLN